MTGKLYDRLRHLRICPSAGLRVSQRIRATDGRGIHDVDVHDRPPHIGMFPRWMTFLGYGLALFLLLSIGRFGWGPLVFPLWALVISVYVLFANFRSTSELNEVAGR